MYLGIEIGGTKLQLAVGKGDGSAFVAFERVDIDPEKGAAGILEQIERVGLDLISQQSVSAIGIGFGGPIDSKKGIVTTSHQIEGWDRFPLAEWCQDKLKIPTYLGNDCDCAALAEARFGAGKGHAAVFYVTVGTGVGGGFVTNGMLYGSGRPAVAEIGHLRPGFAIHDTRMTVESLASGRGIEAVAIAALRQCPDIDHKDLLRRANGRVEGLTARMIAEAAGTGNETAAQVFAAACRALGWGVAQVVTLLAVDVVVIGGGVSLAGEQLFLNPVRDAVKEFVFPPLLDSYEVLPPNLGESVVVFGAQALAAQRQG